MKQLRTLFGLPAWRAACLVALVAALAIAQPARALAQVRLIVHDIQGVFVPDKNAYAVQVYLSVLDDAGKPISGLTAADFTVSEDSQKMAVDQVAKASEPMSIVLMLDTSGSMAGPIVQARDAAKKFVSGLASVDRVALISFNERITRESEFSGNFNAVQASIDKVAVAPNSGTCLYDAAYQAIQLAATEPAGRHAVILLTDGVDELPSPSTGPCSTHVIEDVINLGADVNARTPVYTLGLGNRTDEKVLARIAQMTGGEYLKSPDASQLGRMFSDLSEGLKSQYALSYTSSHAPGAHKVIVEVNASQSKALDSRDYLLPAPPATVTVASPVSGQKVEGNVKAEAAVSAQGKLIGEVIFRLDGVVMGRDDTFPYTLEMAMVAPGAHTLEVSAVGSDGSELAKSSVTFETVAAAAAGSTPGRTTALPTFTPLATATPAAARPPIEAVAAGGIFLLIVLVVAAIVMTIMVARRKAAAQRQAASLQTAGTARAVGQPGQGWQPFPPQAPEVLATLTVRFSDDPGMQNQVLNITKPTTLIGRGAQNDLIFPKDTPVSRQHALIEQKGYQLWLNEARTTDETGTVHRPKYGTYVNEVQVGEHPVLLKTGDILRLGPRVRLEFRLAQGLARTDERTIDYSAETRNIPFGIGAEAAPPAAPGGAGNVTISFGPPPELPPLPGFGSQSYGPTVPEGQTGAAAGAPPFAPTIQDNPAAPEPPGQPGGHSPTGYETVRFIRPIQAEDTQTSEGQANPPPSQESPGANATQPLFGTHDTLPLGSWPAQDGEQPPEDDQVGPDDPTRPHF